MLSKKKIIITVVLVVVSLTVVGAISLVMYNSSQVAPQKSNADTLSCGNSTCDINEQCGDRNQGLPG
jgi:flagellar basal body-associated protein FliL